jgi:alkylation response protein AidB-like acyl-CoA dehydrogenase
MVDFSLTDEQRAMREVAHRFAEKEMRPIAAECDEKQEAPVELIKKAHKAGLIAYPYPEEYGGGGITDPLMWVLIAEEMAWGCSGLSLFLNATILCGIPILHMGTEAQKRKYITRVCNPDEMHLGAMCLTEPGAGSDNAAMKTTAERKGDHYVLNGTKCFISNGGIADVHVVFGRMKGTSGYEGVTAFIIDGHPPGFSMGKKENKMGCRAAPTAEVIFDDVAVPVEDRLGEEGEGFIGAMKMLDASRPLVGAIGVGVARAAYEYAARYATERVAFGKQISRHQAIAFKVADMAMEIEAARNLVWHAAWLAGQDRPSTRIAAMAKCFATDMAMRVTTEAVQVLGGYGYMKDHPVERWMRDAKLWQIGEGTSEIERMVISREVFKQIAKGLPG